MNFKSLFDETIVGISTALEKGAVSIIRLSGNNSIDLVNKVFKGKNLLNAKSHTITYGHIYDSKNDKIIDEVLVSVFRSPRSYTKEDVVEINCHGGILVTNIIFNLLVEFGARIAEPGEFTKRAFFNGRIDLTKAEAVMDVIDAENKKALDVANSTMNGSIKKVVLSLQERLINIIAQINVNIDYPEYDDVEQLENEVIKPEIKKIKIETEEIINKAKDVFKIKSGINTVIVGKPNVGKSSLMNALLSENKAIVTSVPGTTRDAIEAKLNLGTITLNLIDTAGVRETEDVVEKIGVQITKEKIANADLLLAMFDGNKELTEEDYDILEQIKDKKHISIINKSDLEQKIDITKLDKYIYVSAKTQDNLDALEKEILNTVISKDFDPSKTSYISNARQLNCMQKAKEALDIALESIENQVDIDIIELYLKDAWFNLGSIIGNVEDDGLLDNLFSKFCLGK